MNSKQFIIPKITKDKFQTYEIPKQFMEGGGDGKVYRISDEYVAKIPHNLLWIGREMKIAKMLYESGISVPEPIGWDYVKTQEQSEPRKAFIMEFIEGHTGGCVIGPDGYLLSDPLSLERQHFARVLAEEEIRKAERLGFRMKDTNNSWNYILTPDEKIKLIDFSTWYHSKVPELKIRYKGDERILKNFVDPETIFNSCSKTPSLENKCLFGRIIEKFWRAA